MVGRRPLLRKQLLAGTPPPWLGRNPRAERVALAALSCPDWADGRAINDMAREAKRKTLATGVPHVVGHIYPLSHPIVCGLTVPNNLRVMTKKENDRWGNRLHLALQIGLFEDPEQLSIF
jgi:hypothetical protein